MKQIGVCQLGRLVEIAPDLEKLDKNLKEFLAKKKV